MKLILFSVVALLVAGSSGSFIRYSSNSDDASTYLDQEKVNTITQLDNYNDDDYNYDEDPFDVTTEKGHDECDESAITTDHSGKPALHVAIENGSKRMVECLINKSVDVNIKDSDGNSALKLALKKGNDEITKLLIQNGANLNANDNASNTALHIAAMSDTSLDVVRFLIEHGADVNARNLYKYSALLTAAERGNVDIAKILIEHGANLDVTDIFGNSPLHMAVDGHEDLVRLLIDSGANMRAVNINEKTPLQVAISKGETKIAEMLETADDKPFSDDSVKAKDPFGFTLLHYAARNGNMHDVRKLIKQGADINAKTLDEYTPLHLAAMN
ncbi:26S proteasome non-ATPase regulatory subunit 10-like, partial [Sitodiplosis mosellana]|uniref:26S proteasome non-ATPase regulatory subunit 10-like n=1 Tax=Sitodiplosis mosellana TaxID=263140 RepID=UPI0024449318